jgi:hypothetical protein
VVEITYVWIDLGLKGQYHEMIILPFHALWEVALGSNFFILVWIENFVKIGSIF